MILIQFQIIKNKLNESALHKISRQTNKSELERDMETFPNFANLLVNSQNPGKYIIIYPTSTNHFPLLYLVQTFRSVSNLKIVSSHLENKTQ